MFPSLSNIDVTLKGFEEVMNDTLWYLHSNTVKIAVVGNTKAGKSTLLNSILQ